MPEIWNCEPKYRHMALELSLINFVGNTMLLSEDFSATFSSPVRQNAHLEVSFCGEACHDSIKYESHKMPTLSSDLITPGQNGFPEVQCVYGLQTN